MARINLWLLGSPRIEIEERVIDFGTRKAMALLSYLATTGQPHTRDATLSLLWPEYDSEKGRAALRTTLSILRKSLGDNVLSTTRQQIKLVRSSEIWIDVREFLADTQDALMPEQSQEKMIQSLEQSAALYNGDFLTGFSLRDSVEFDDWQLLKAETLRRQYSQNLGMLIQCHTIQGTFPSAITHAHRLLALDPLDEASRRSLMKLYVWTGQRSLALRQFEECQQILQKELGISPSEKTKKLHENIKAEILERAPTAPLEQRPVLNAETGPLIRGDLKARIYRLPEMVLEKPRRLLGRAHLIKDIHSLLDDGEPVLLHGLGGMGKTSLAATVAAERIELTQQPVIWLEAGDADVDTLFEALAHPFGQRQAIARTAGDDRVVAIRELLLKQQALLVLDNIWNDRALYKLMKAIPPGMPVIATSRQSIPIDGKLIAVPELAAKSALALLNYYARNEFSVESGAESLCKLLGGHPFALEVAGNQLKLNPLLTPTHLMENIAGAPHDLSMPGHFAEFGREAVKDLLDSSVNGLEKDAYAIFVNLGALFASSASIELLGLVTGRKQQDISNILATLQQHGLARIFPMTESMPEYYRIHDLTYSYARDIFRKQGGDRYRQVTVDAVQNFVADHSQDYDGLEFEQVNILGAVQAAHRAEEYGVSLGILSQLATDGYLDARGYAPLMLECIEDAIDVGMQMGPDHHETLHFLTTKRGNAFANSGDLDRALTAYEIALELAPNLHRKAIILCVIGGVRFRQGADDYDDYLEEAYRIAKAEKDDIALGRVLEFRGNCVKIKGDYEAAHHLYTQSVEVAKRTGDNRRLVFSLYNLAIAKTDLGHHQQALVIHQRIHQLGQDNSNHEWVAMAASGMARSYHNLGKHSEVHNHLKTALTLYRKIGDNKAANWVIDFAKKENYPIAIES
jgi:DNA-binding SARP family transcriptional activator